RDACGDFEGVLKQRARLAKHLQELGPCASPQWWLSFRLPACRRLGPATSLLTTLSAMIVEAARWRKSAVRVWGHAGRSRRRCGLLIPAITSLLLTPASRTGRASRFKGRGTVGSVAFPQSLAAMGQCWTGRCLCRRQFGNLPATACFGRGRSIRVFSSY